MLMWKNKCCFLIFHTTFLFFGFIKYLGNYRMDPPQNFTAIFFIINCRYGFPKKLIKNKYLKLNFSVLYQSSMFYVMFFLNSQKNDFFIKDIYDKYIFTTEVIRGFFGYNWRTAENMENLFLLKQFLSKSSQHS